MLNSLNKLSSQNIEIEENPTNNQILGKRKREKAENFKEEIKKRKIKDPKKPKNKEVSIGSNTLRNIGEYGVTKNGNAFQRINLNGVIVEDFRESDRLENRPNVIIEDDRRGPLIIDVRKPIIEDHRTNSKRRRGIYDPKILPGDIVIEERKRSKIMFNGRDRDSYYGEKKYRDQSYDNIGSERPSYRRSQRNGTPSSHFSRRTYRY